MGKMQNRFIDRIAGCENDRPNREFDGDHFRFRGIDYDMFDIWGLACEHLLNNNEYKQMCLDNKWETTSGKYFKTSAEMAYRYFKGDMEFDESHTAFEDAEIETELFAEIVKRSKNKYKMGIEYFPFRILGKVADFEMWLETQKLYNFVGL